MINRRTGYVPLLQRSLKLWRGLNERDLDHRKENTASAVTSDETDKEDSDDMEPLLKMTGALMIGAAADLEVHASMTRTSFSKFLGTHGASLPLPVPQRGRGVIGGTIASAREWGLEHEVLSADDMRERYPAFKLKPEEVALFEKDAALLVPERCAHPLHFSLPLPPPVYPFS